jgi:hypothetical protein
LTNCVNQLAIANKQKSKNMGIVVPFFTTKKSKLFSSLQKMQKADGTTICLGS